MAADILGVISSSLSDAQPVFDAIVQNGIRLFSGAAVSIALVDNGMVKAAAVADVIRLARRLGGRRFPSRCRANKSQCCDFGLQDGGYSGRRKGAGKNDSRR